MSAPDHGSRLSAHPAALAWEQFRSSQPWLFDARVVLSAGEAAGAYLSNRMNEAFCQGWLAAEREHRKATE